MNVQTYQKRKQEEQRQREEGQRLRCPHCHQPDFSCYCAWLRPFDPQIIFVILIHPREMRKRIATGRMAHLMLQNSELISGESFHSHGRVQAILQDPTLHCCILYPGAQAKNLGTMSASERMQLVPPGKRLAIFVLDGTWSTAKKMVYRSPNLQALPQICFTPKRPSNFRIRQQPRVECYSTIEAIHATIDHLAPPNRAHDHLLTLFDQMVDRQIELARGAAR